VFLPVVQSSMEAAMKANDVLSIVDAAAEARCSGNFLYAEIRDGRLACIRSGGRVFVHRQDFEHWLAEYNKRRRPAVFQPQEVST
jgi:Helix-turn-helix domain